MFRHDRHSMNKTLSCILAALAALAAHAASAASAAEPSCARQLGAKPAALLVAQCTRVSPATHPPCNVANSCAMVVGEIERSCNLLEGESYAPKFCKVADMRKGTARATGVLMPSDSGDYPHLRVMTDQGVQMGGFCVGDKGCAAWFVDGKEGEAPLALDPKLRGRRVEVEFVTEPNRGRIESDEENAILTFVKRAALLK